MKRWTRAPQRGTARALTYSVLVHAAALALLLMSFHFSKPTHVYAFRAAHKPLVGELVNSQMLQQEQAQLARAQAKAQAQAQAQAAQARAAAQAQRAAAKAARQAKLEAAKAQRAAERQAQQAAQAAKKEALAEAAARAQAEQARKRARLAARRSRLKAEQEAQRRARRVRQLQQELAQQQQAARSSRARAALQRQLAVAAAAQRRAQTAVQQALVSKYNARIQRKVSANWTRPPGGADGLRCVVQVQLLPQGDVLSVHILQSSGDAAFDRSVEAAVYRASPLPVPHDPQLAQDFGQITFTFKPGK
ncbi:MAG TPA: cell envelope integrity protein TolA [Acidiferrobacteraceae bacterium]|nr:cell envelope integrity protein TolA [Acidiferrobacteraceae bacterium]